MTEEERLSAIRSLEEEIKAKKDRFRDPEHQPPSSWRYYDLFTLKHRATVLYAATAMMRGKLHFSKSKKSKREATMEAQQEFLAKNLPMVLMWMEKEGRTQQPPEANQGEATTPS